MVKRERVQLICTDPSRTKQSFKAECDINEIVRRFRKTTGSDVLDRLNGYLDPNVKFGDFSMIPDYRQAREHLLLAESSFMALPAMVRKQFDNDAALFLDFVHNPDNEQQLVAWGLATPKPQQTAVVGETK